MSALPDRFGLEPVLSPSNEDTVMCTVATEIESRGRIACPVCGFPIGAVRGSKAAICANCGFKDSCC